MAKHKFDAKVNKEGDFGGLKIRQIQKDIVTSEWVCENTRVHEEGSNKFSVQLMLGENGRPNVKIDVIDGASLGSKEICRLLYDLYYSKYYKESEVEFEFRAKGYDRYAKIEIASRL